MVVERRIFFIGFIMYNCCRLIGCCVGWLYGSDCENCVMIVDVFCIECIKKCSVYLNKCFIELGVMIKGIDIDLIIILDIRIYCKGRVD